MPELPEVETVKRGLERLIIGKTILSEIHDWPKSFPNDEQSVRQFMLGATIEAVSRRGKAIIINLDTNYSLVVHLKMTGQIVYIKETSVSRASKVRNDLFEERTKEYRQYSAGAPQKNLTQFAESTGGVGGSASQQAGAPGGAERFGAGHPNDSLLGNLPDRSTRIEITFTDKSKLFFNDQRKFGWMRLIPTLEVDDMTFFKTLGPEPLVESFTAKEFIARIARRKNTSIKAAILDQKVLAGVGNIYADEALFGARIHPARKVGELTKNQLTSLLVHIKAVMLLSIEKGGSTDKNYIDAEGRRGSYLEFAHVFRREGQSCLVDGSTIIKTRVAGRGTHYCPTCQPAPRGFKR